MLQDIFSAYSIFCELKEFANKAKIISLQKLPDILYYMYYMYLLMIHVCVISKIIFSNDILNII